MGTQDDFAFAQEFVSTGLLEDSEATFLWDPGFATWQAFGVRLNSSMAIMSGDATRVSEVFFGFGESEQQQILASLAEFQ